MQCVGEGDACIIGNSGLGHMGLPFVAFGDGNDIHCLAFGGSAEGLDRNESP